MTKILGPDWPYFSSMFALGRLRFRFTFGINSRGPGNVAFPVSVLLCFCCCLLLYSPYMYFGPFYLESTNPCSSLTRKILLSPLKHEARPQLLKGDGRNPQGTSTICLFIHSR